MSTQVDISSIVMHDKLSSLLAAALADAKRIRDAENPQYQLDMLNWMNVTDADDGSVCTVCLAGAMLVEHITFDQVRLMDTRRPTGANYASLCPGDFADKTTRYMRAIDACRDGDLLYALIQFYGRQDLKSVDEIGAIATQIRERVLNAKQISTGWPIFRQSPGLWWETMDELVRQLAEAGQ